MGAPLWAPGDPRTQLQKPTFAFLRKIPWLGPWSCQPLPHTPLRDVPSSLYLPVVTEQTDSGPGAGHMQAVDS